DGEDDPGADDEQPVANYEPCDVGHREPRLPIPNGPTHVEVVNASVGGRYFLLTEVVAYNRLLRSPHLVEPPHGASVRRLVQDLGRGGRLLGDPAHRLDEYVEPLLGLRLGRFDHEGFGHDEREVD